MRHVWIVLIVSMSTAGACTSDSTSQQFCNRAQTCNLLNTSVDECTQDLQSQIAELPESQQQELNYELEQCLSHPSCDGFSQCVGDLNGSNSGSGN
jgi:hypothetical protein